MSSTQQFMHEDQVQSGLSVFQVIKRLAPYFFRQKNLLSLTLVSILIINVLSRLQPNLIGHAITEGIEKSQYTYVKEIAYIYLIIQLINLLFSFLQFYWVQKLGNKVLFDVRQDLVNHVEHLPITYFNKTPTGRVVTRLTNDTSQLADMFHEGLIEIFVNVVQLIFIIAAIAFISPTVAIMMVFLSPLYVISNFKISEKVRVTLRDLKKKMSAINSFVAENINGMKVIQLYNRKEKNLNHFQKLAGEYRTLNLKSTHYYALMHPIMNTFNGLIFAVVLYYGGKAVNMSALEIGSFVALFMHVQDFIPPLRDILEKYQNFQNSITSAERIFQLFDEVDEIQKHETHHLPNSIQGDIKVKNLNFQYEAHLPLVLKDVSLHIQAGQSVAIIGRTGSGKSTFISLLQKFYEVPEGKLFLDDMDIFSLDKGSLRRHISIVQQDPFIFRGSILSNITMDADHISEAQALRAAEQVGLIQHLKYSLRDLNSKVEEKGANLSVGEKQLIAFARVIAFNPSLIILDEATANIDSQTEDQLQKATLEVTKNRTSIIVAHRLSTIRHCDRVIVFDGGRIQEKSKNEPIAAEILKAETEPETVS